jgi:hypothetical protein
MIRFLVNVGYIIADFRRSFGLLASIIFTVFLLSLILFILFEIAQFFLPFTYVAF